MVNWFVFQFCLNVDEWNELQKEACLVNRMGFRKKEAQLQWTFLTGSSILSLVPY